MKGEENPGGRRREGEKRRGGKVKIDRELRWTTRHSTPPPPPPPPPPNTDRQTDRQTGELDLVSLYASANQTRVGSAQVSTSEASMSGLGSLLTPHSSLPSFTQAERCRLLYLPPPRSSIIFFLSFSLFFLFLFFLVR